MFNASNILEALKNYIRTRGGESTANNIAEAVNDLNSVPQGSGGDIPDEVTNAIETHGMGWTSEEEVEGFDIQWDGNTEGHEGIPALVGGFYKVSDVLDIMNPIENLIGANYIVYTPGGPVEGTVTAEDILTDDNKVFTVLALDDSLIIIALEDGHSGELDVPKGVWFANIPNYFGYVSRLYKEATTEEVVHQIDSKYIPQSSGGAMVVNFTTTLVDYVLTLSADKTPAEVKSAMLSGIVVGTILFPGETEITPLGPAMLTPDAPIGFAMYALDAQTLSPKYMITCDQSFTEWIIHAD